MDSVSTNYTPVFQLHNFYIKGNVWSVWCTKDRKCSIKIVQITANATVVWITNFFFPLSELNWQYHSAILPYFFMFLWLRDSYVNILHRLFCMFNYWCPYTIFPLIHFIFCILIDSSSNPGREIKTLMQYGFSLGSVLCLSLLLCLM